MSNSTPYLQPSPLLPHHNNQPKWSLDTANHSCPPLRATVRRGAPSSDATHLTLILPYQDPKPQKLHLLAHSLFITYSLNLKSSEEKQIRPSLVVDTFAPTRIVHGFTRCLSLTAFQLSIHWSPGAKGHQRNKDLGKACWFLFYQHILSIPQHQFSFSISSPHPCMALNFPVSSCTCLYPAGSSSILL